jgi:predicted metal-dependent phosphoesterase TrpH
MIDLHLHTTASDGRCSPDELVDRAAAAGVTIMAVTDHDTTAGIGPTRQAARRRHIHVVSGIEITAVDEGHDVHMLGYFVDEAHAPLAAFLSRQRTTRIARVEQIAERLAALGMPIDAEPLIARAREDGGRQVGRPHIAHAMIDAGYVADTREAFDRWLASGRPAFVPREGASPQDVIALVHDAGGKVSLAHPGQTQVDGRIEHYARAGLDALELYHPDHDADSVGRYRDIAARLHLLVTGGSDFHGDASHGWEPGSVSLPAEDWRRFQDAPRHA